MDRRQPVNAQFRLGDACLDVSLEGAGPEYRVVVGGTPYAVSVVRAKSGSVTFRSGSAVVTAHYAFDGERVWVALAGETYVFDCGTPCGSTRAASAASEPAGEQVLRAPMPGHVRSVACTEGALITQGQTCFVLEAMKMEIQIKAPRSGRVIRIAAAPGQSVARDQILAEVE